MAKTFSDAKYQNVLHFYASKSFINAYRCLKAEGNYEVASLD